MLGTPPLLLPAHLLLVVPALLSLLLLPQLLLSPLLLWGHKRTTMKGADLVPSCRDSSSEGYRAVDISSSPEMTTCPKALSVLCNWGTCWQGWADRQQFSVMPNTLSFPVQVDSLGFTSPKKLSAFSLLANGGFQIGDRKHQSRAGYSLHIIKLLMRFYRF